MSSSIRNQILLSSSFKDRGILPNNFKTQAFFYINCKLWTNTYFFPRLFSITLINMKSGITLILLVLWTVSTFLISCINEDQALLQRGHPMCRRPRKVWSHQYGRPFYFLFSLQKFQCCCILINGMYYVPRSNSQLFLNASGLSKKKNRGSKNLVQDTKQKIKGNNNKLII